MEMRSGTKWNMTIKMQFQLRWLLFLSFAWKNLENPFFLLLFICNSEFGILFLRKQINFPVNWNSFFCLLNISFFILFLIKLAFLCNRIFARFSLLILTFSAMIPLANGNVMILINFQIRKFLLVSM